MDTLSEARQALLMNAVVAVVLNLLFIFVGTVLFAFYHQVGATGFPDLANQDQILPYFLTTEIPAIGLTGILVAGLFGAGMSSLDSGINSMSAVVVYDWLPDQDISVRFSRLLCGLFGVCITAAALLMPYLGQFVIEMITKIAGTFLGLLLGVYLLGMFVPRANSSGAFIGLFAGVVVLALVWIGTMVPHWWYGGITLATTFIIGGGSSYLFQTPKEEQLVGLVYK